MAARRADPASAPKTKTRARPQLDVATILDAALRLAATGGSEPLTVRRLGTELGADPTAIYRHFRDKDELVRGVLDRLISDSVARVDPHASWRDRLSELAHVSLEIFCAHPSVGALAGSQTTGGQGELAAIEMIIVAMNEAGLRREDSVRFYAVYSSYVIAFSSAQASSMLGLDQDDDGRWIGASPAVHHTRHPAIAAVRDELEGLRDSDIYESGIQVILDAIEARAAATRR
jgi:AcrR family transcriptional regulator